MIRLSTTSGGDSINYSFTTLERAAEGVNATTGGRTYIHSMGVVAPTSRTTYYIVGYQTSGGNLAAVARHDCVRLI